MNIKKIHQRWINAVEEPGFKNELAAMAEPEINDAFYKDLAFGTGGLRGVMGAGTNRMNIYTVNRATQGLCDFLKSEKRTPSVAIAYDSRLHSGEFAASAATVIAANGGTAYLFAQLMPTPVLSYAVRTLQCDAGIVITASHNPGEYNGYKVYGSDGCQITLEAAGSIQKCIEKTDVFEGVKKEPFEKAAAEGRIRIIGGDILEQYLNRVLLCSVNPELLKGSDLKVIYTPLNGAGNKPVREILKRAGLKNLTVEPKQENPDGGFPTCRKPNPEERSAYEMAIRLAKTVPADLLIATDPDCDRVGIAVKYGRGYRLLTGNETGCLLLNYILSQKREKNALPKHPVVIKTIVTSAMADCIAKEYGAKVIDTLTGFKYIGEQIGLLEERHEENNYVFGFEESYGYLPEIFVRDKDAVSATLLICEMAAFYKKQRSTLPAELNKLNRKHGFWKHKLLSFSFGGADGMKKMNDIMTGFRKGAFDSFAELPIVKTDDYLSSVTVNRKNGKTGALQLPKSDVLLFSIENGVEIVIRPSGTEPKLKCYLTVRADEKNAANRLLKQLEADLEEKMHAAMDG